MSKNKGQSEKMERLMSRVQDHPLQRERRGPTDQISPTPFEWKIPNITQVVLKSNSQGIQSLFSKPFCLFSYGYKHLLKIDIFRMRPHNLLSVEIKVILGEFDEYLSWPCKEKVRVTLVAQGSLLGKNISEVIDFEKGERPCSRPPSDYRPILALTNVYFLPGSYIKNGTILIRANRE